MIADKIPQQIQVGGQTVDIMRVEQIEGGSLGECLVSAGFIKIARTAKGYAQSDDSQFNTFIHECVHCILDNMGENELSENEKFVNAFSGFATEIIRSIMK